jgi:hypothetical protein
LAGALAVQGMFAEVRRAAKSADIEVVRAKLTQMVDALDKLTGLVLKACAGLYERR